MEQVAYFEDNALVNSELIITTANQQIQNGSINYLEWGQLMDKAIAVQDSYVDTVMGLNETAIQLNYFLER